MRNVWEARNPSYPTAFEGQVILEHASHGTVVKGVEAEAFHVSISNKGEEFDERMHMGGLSFKSEGTPLNETWTIEMEGLWLRALNPLRESLRFSHPLVMDPPWRRSFINWILPGAGLVDGKITIHKAKGGSCHGAIEVSNARGYGEITLPFIGVVDSLNLIDTLKLRCDGQQFHLASTGFRSFNDKLAGQISLVAGQLNLKASLQSPLQYEFSSQSINNHYLEVTGGELNSELHLFGPVTGLEGWINLTVSGVRSDIRGPFAFLIENSTTYLPPLKAQVQLASELSTQDFDFQVWGSLQAEAGESNLAVAGPLTPNLNLRSTTLKVAPRDWLPPTVSTYNLGLPYQPYEGQITVTQSATGKPRFSACLQETPIFLQQAGIKVCD